jgi:hypothetical protein
MRIHIRRISPPSLSIVLGVIYGIVGFAVGALGVFGLLVSFGIGSPVRDGVSSMPMMLVVQPLISALIGVVTGFIVAWLYNFVARFTKGVLIEYSEAGRHDD